LAGIGALQKPVKARRQAKTKRPSSRFIAVYKAAYLAQNTQSGVKFKAPSQALVCDFAKIQLQN